MSDFIKVNFKNGHSSVIHRSQFELVLCPENIYCFTEIQTLFSHCGALTYPDDKIAYLEGFKDKCKITREEYNRLCKELGVER